MGALTDKWNTAKTKFENDTGVKKPKEVATLKIGPFAKEYDKQSGLEKAFKAVDDLIPESLFTVIGEKKEKQLDSAIKDLDDKAGRYIGVLNGAIADAKKSGGKIDSIYRDLKILRSELEALCARAKLDHSKIVANREAAEGKVNDGAKQTLMMLNSLSQALDYNINSGIKSAQEMLKAGTADFYNQKIKDTARNITQPLVNVIKFGLPAEMGEKAQSSFREAIQVSAVFEKAQDIAHKVYGIQNELKRYNKPEGSTPTDANLVLMAADKVKLPKDASKEDVVAAIKHLLLQIKEAKRMADDLRRALG